MNAVKKSFWIVLLVVLSILVLSCRYEEHETTITKDGDQHVTSDRIDLDISFGDNEAHTRSTEQISLDRQNATALDVTTTNGDIHVVPGDGNTIQVQAAKEVHADSAETAKVFLKQIKLVTRQENDSWIVKVDCPRSTPQDVHSVTVSLEIHAPASMRLIAQSDNGSLNVSRMAEAHLRTQNGKIQADHIAGVLDAHSSNGSIETEACVDVPEVETQNGEITLHGVGHLGTVKTENGAIKIQMAEKQDTEPVEIRSVNGEIDLGLPADASAHLEAGVDIGSIDMEPSERAHFNSEEHTQMTADLGSGKGPMRLHSSAGSIHIYTG